MTDFSKARTNMIDGQIHTSGVVDPLILDAFNSIPRELFFPEKLQDIAYTDENIDIGQNRFMMNPIVYSKMLQASMPQADDIVLDIGSASGYSSAILSRLSATVIAVDNNKRQMEKAAKMWGRLDCNNIVQVEGALAQGCAEHAPYSLIVMNGSVESVPRSILEQIDINGRLVTVIKKAGEQMGQATLFYKHDANAVSSRPLFDAGTPFLEGFAPSPVFHF